MMARVVEVMGGEGVIAFPEIGRGFFAGEKNTRTGIKAMMMAEVRVNDEVGFIAEFDVESFGQEINEEILRFAEARPKVAKIDSYRRCHQFGRMPTIKGGWQVWCCGWYGDRHSDSAR